MDQTFAVTEGMGKWGQSMGGAGPASLKGKLMSMEDLI